MNRSQLNTKLAKEHARTSSRSEYLQKKQDETAETNHRIKGGVGNTTFIGVLEPVGNGGHRVYVPLIAVKNADARTGDRVEVSIRRAEA